VDFLSGVVEAAFAAGARLSDIFFASLLIPLGFFSSPEVPDLALSSFEACDRRGRWVPATAGVAAAGFLAAVAAVGRAGGLLSVLPAEVRAAVVLVGVMNEGVLEGGVFAVVNGRLGGCGLAGAAA